MATNDFLVFGGGSSPNVIDQATYAALTARQAGFQSGTALSAQLNKVWRQSSIMAAVLAQFTANFSGQNSVDDGTTAALLANLQAAINAAGITAPQFDSSTKLATTAFVQRALGNYGGALVINAASTLTNGAAGQIVELNGTSTFTTTLPLSAVVAVGGRMAFINQSGVDQNIATQGTEKIWSYFGGLVSSIVLHSGDSLELFSRGGQWDVCGGTVALRNVQGATTQTPAQFDSSAKLATTAFVQQAGGNFQTRKYINGSGTLAASDTGSWIEAGGTGPTTITLPAPTTSNLTYTITNVTGNGTAVTISTPSASIYNQASAASTFSLDVGATVELVSDASNWTVISHYTRSPIAQTPAQFDNDTSLATTAFVQRALGNFQNFYSYTTSQTLIGAQAGAVINFWGTSASTFTLPSAYAMPICGTLYFINSGSAALTVSRAGSDSIVGVGANTSVVLNPGDSLLLVTTNGANQWIAIGGSAQLPYAGTAQRTSGGVVGAVRNASMSVSAASATATFTADEIVVETALGGGFFRLAAFNKAINLATTGAGGMDTGSAPTNGYVALYAIYNPTTGDSALLARNATSAVQPNVYGGANMPAGYTASALVSVWGVNGSGQFNTGYQIDRQIYSFVTNALNTTTLAGSFTSFTFTNVPLNAKTVSGNATATNSASNNTPQAALAASATGLAEQDFSATAVIAGGGIQVPFSGIPLITPQTLYYKLATVSSGTPNFAVNVTGYSI